MTLAYNMVPKTYSTMIVRVPMIEIDTLPIDSVLENLESFIVRLYCTPGIANVMPYSPADEADAVVGELMPSGEYAYRLIMDYSPDMIYDTAVKRVAAAWEEFSKSSSHEVGESQQAHYHADGSFHFYIGA